MPRLFVPASPSIWIPRLTRAQEVAGVMREMAEQRADESYEKTIAPSCPACGKPVRDEDYQKHAYEDHGVNETCQPRGTPDAREVLFLGGSKAHLDEREARWRRLHPGCGLALLGDGHEVRGKVTILWRRARVLDGKGRPAS